MSDQTFTQEWQQLAKNHFDHWGKKLDRVNYALSKSANSWPTNYFYPKLYQRRWLLKQIFENMQIIGDVKPEEIDNFQQLSGKSVGAKYLHATKGFWEARFNRYRFVDRAPGFLLWFAFNALSFRTCKGISWQVVPGLIALVLWDGWLSRHYYLHYGDVIDFTNWVVENRKARSWLESYPKPLPIYGSSLFVTHQKLVEFSQQ